MEIQEISLRCDVKSAEAETTVICLLNLSAQMVEKATETGNRSAEIDTYTRDSIVVRGLES